jgi:protein SCO1/2
MKIFTIFFLLIVVLSFKLEADQEKAPVVGIVEKLDNTIPKDLKFVNSNGDTVKLGDIITKPTVLTLVFYHCTGICSPLLTNLAEVVDKTDLQPGKDYQLITISFDHHEQIEAAQRWRKTHLEEMKKQIKPDDWRFLVGDSVSIRKLCDAVGFYFKPDGLIISFTLVLCSLYQITEKLHVTYLEQTTILLILNLLF